MSSHFASRLRKDLSTEMIRTQIAHRKSLSQKENRHKVYERNRHFGLKDVNIPLEGRDLVNIHEMSLDLAPEKASTKTKSEKTVLSDQRKQLLQKYKEEKQLQKLKEQREKAKRGVFKVGLYRPAAPGFLVTDQRSVRTQPAAPSFPITDQRSVRTQPAAPGFLVTNQRSVRTQPAAPSFPITDQRSVRTQPEKAFPYNGRITRSKAKDHMEHTKIESKNVLQTTRCVQKQTSEKKILDKEKKVMQPMVSSGRVTGSAAPQRTKQTAQTVSSAPRKPVTRVAGENESERVGPSRGRPARKVEAKLGKVLPSKVDKENSMDPQTSVTNGMDLGGVFPEVESSTKTVKERKSFAPTHCVFQPPCGLKTYQVAPMGHRSDSALLTPSCDWNPLKAEVTTTQDAANEILVQKSLTCSTDTVQQERNDPPSALGSPAVCKEEHGLNQKEASTTDSSRLSVGGVTSLEEGEGQVSQPQHDVPYFRKILQSETDKLTSQCLEWDRKLELDIPDDAKDLIRTTVGQTRLLIMERFKQFEGLVDNCEYKRGEKETTCSNLDGFWDMVNFQVDDVNQKFNNLIKLEEAGWKNDNNPSKKVLRKKIVPAKTSKAKQDDDGRMAVRNRLAAIKNAMRERLKQEEHAPAAAVEAPKEVDKIVFDAGFFRIESPVKSFAALSSERRSQRFGALKSASRVIPESGAAGDLPNQRVSLENPDPHSSKSESVAKTLFPDILESRSSRMEDTSSPGEQDSSAIDHDVNKMNVAMDCSPAGGVADDTKQTEALSDVEGAELHSKVSSQDVLMSNPEKNSPSPSASSQEEGEVSQSVPLHRQVTSELYPLNPPALSSSSPCTRVETRQRDRARYVSFGGDLIVFSPLRPRSREHQEGF
ncbi:disks large-associated protein 5-like [Peromyscus leucopus]|uniref:disks large-associated protein 5-like n=1 Tax=Peromyscus leucopus TaxID=10041 RepID=UPI0010A107FF|nr:disks large-associated protein 5-like [Peromyscus leucopus]